MRWCWHWASRPTATFLRKVPGLTFTRDGAVEVGADLMTGAPGVFAGGDMVPGAQSVTIAVGQGKRAARQIDAWLAGTAHAEPPAAPVVTADMLHLPVYTDADPSAQRRLALEARADGFEEIMAGLSDRKARYEAQRCYSCGQCYECDQCLAACPEEAIGKLGIGKGYAIDMTRCTGCASCFEQCPCHAIEMIPEDRA
jgi:formate dehydrogenase beta subunit